MNNSIINTNIQKKLQVRLTEKHRELLDILNQRFILVNEKVPQIVYQYELLFGKLEDELFYLNEIAVKIEKVIDIILVKAKRGVRMDIKQINRIESDVMRNIGEIKKRNISVENDDIRRANPAVNNTTDDNKYSDLSTLFRSLVKLLHPDKGSKAAEFGKYWDIVLDAYKMKDIIRLKIYYNLISSECVFCDDNDDSFSQFRKDMWQIKRRIEFEKRKTNRLLTDEPYSLVHVISDNVWIDERKKLLEAKICTVRSEIAKFDEILNQIKSGDYFELEEREDLQFQEQFIENTYFKY